MADLNKHQLSRRVPDPVKREIRQRCGFGCVICGLSLYDYEHFDPDFKDAKEHDPNGMTLLCMQCNQKRNRKMLSVETVRAANLEPICKQQGFASEHFDYGSEEIEVEFAGCSFIACDHLIVVDDIPILSIAKPNEDGAPFRLSGRFCDAEGAATLKIVDNIWSVGADNWDVECEGPRITIRRGLGDIVLVLKSEPPKKLIVERINMEFEGVFLKGDQQTLEISFDNIHWGQWTDCSMSHCHIGIQLNTA